jgi:large subunit ribosomal protein L13
LEVALNKKLEREWYLIDAKDKILGRIASRIAIILQGKHKPDYLPNIDCGDYVVVINAEKIKLTGKKREKKVYYYHTGYPGGLKEIGFQDLMKKNPAKIMWLAVKGMLPHNKLGKAMLKKLKIYQGNQHPHIAQSPKSIEIN